MLVFGTRPEAIKMAPLIKVLQKDQHFITKVAVTAQHREMLDQVLELFEITPDYDLNIMKSGQTLIGITTRVLEGLSEILVEEQPDMVLVHGDTSTTFVSSLAAFYNKIAIGHVEAGLRTFDKTQPFPEEINRRLTGTMADLHFSPTPRAKGNLLAEGIKPENVYVTGNTVIDALLPMVEKDYVFTEPILNKLDFTKPILLGEAHRRENLGKPLEDIFDALLEIVDTHPEAQLVYSVHPNPLVKETARKMLGGKERIFLIDPPAYKEWVNLMARATLLLTDSGGLQEEAPAVGVPVLVLRDVTERPEGIRTGTLKLVGTDKEEIISLAHKLLTDKEAYLKMAQAPNPYGDGKACERIRDALLNYYFDLERPRDYIIN